MEVLTTDRSTAMKGLLKKINVWRYLLFECNSTAVVKNSATYNFEIHSGSTHIRPELGTSLFEIALSLFTLERTLILGAMALLETKSEAL